MKHKRLTAIRGQLTYANVMVTLLAVIVLGGGGAYAMTLNSPSNERADLGVSISGPASLAVPSTAGSSTPSVDTVTVRNKGPARTRPIVFVSVPGHTLTQYNNAPDNDQSTSLGTTYDPSHSFSGCIPLGPAGAISAPFNTSGAQQSSGAVVCEGPKLGKGKQASFQIAYASYPCAGNYTVTTSALAISALLDPHSGNDEARQTMTVSPAGGCG